MRHAEGEERECRAQAWAAVPRHWRDRRVGGMDFSAAAAMTESPRGQDSLEGPGRATEAAAFPAFPALRECRV